MERAELLYLARKMVQWQPQCWKRVHARKLNDEEGSSVYHKEQVVNSQFEVHKNNINL